ncbi:MAG TPA: SDR family oxidoreductase [Herpetosiphonaceae bacterium]|nr:SDR family oxidoreductase [Herpetosiphonaceae bacterium]
MRKILLVTGGGRGIGAATARLAASRGYAVVLTYRSDRAAADGVVADIAAAGGDALALRADAGVEADMLKVFARLDAWDGRLAALVNNAAVLERQMRFDQMDVERWQRILNTNVIGAFVSCREAVRRMSTRYGGSGGAIVNVSSVAAELGSPGEYVDYAASKGAIDTLTVGLAREVAGEGIRVNAVRPGIIYTDIHASGGDPGRVDRLKTGVPMGRGGQADEVARSILWLLSDEASYVTGACLNVSGGR